ncbi:MAG TPA: MerR family transcriptional regulator [Dermatophilaceae bacterium]|nr:MerR family transcriptional regulator [Dermatophilaceae bacterium]
MTHESAAAVLRIGELSRRVGVSEHVLRAWESRYGLLRPERSAGGYRLYSEDDQNRVARMQAHLADGLAAAQAAQAAMADELWDVATDGGDAAREVSGAGLSDSAGAFRQALDALDEPAAQAVLDQLLTDFTVESVLREVVLPYLHALGDRWESGEVSIAQEHFASNVVRGRLASLARGWGYGEGPQVLLACPPDEQHELALLVFGIVLSRKGWRVGYLGANTPMLDTIEVAAQTRPSLVVLAATTPERFTAVAPELARLVDLSPLVLAGAGASADLARSIGARVLAGDPVTAAEQIAGS